MNMRYHLFFSLLIVMLLFAACSTPRTVLDNEELQFADITADSLVSLVPDYSATLNTISGKGRAMVSEPGNSDRVTLEYHSDRETSLITVRTGVGIEGGSILVDRDSLLIYNRVDRVAEKVPVAEGRLTSVGSIASLNMLDLFNFVIRSEDILQIYDDRSHYVALLEDESVVRIEKQSGLVKEVRRPETSPGAAYSLIEYEGYATIEGFQLPRKITIFSRDGNSRAVFLVQQLEVNSELPPLELTIPDNVPIMRR